MGEIMDFMMRDHQRLDALFARYREDKHDDLMAALEAFQNFRQGLEQHICWEEEILFPVFEKRTQMMEQGPTMVMRMEHRQIKSLLANIESLLKDDKTPPESIDEELILLLKRHNQKEEAVLYPWMDDVLTPEERANLLSRMHDMT